MTASWLAQMGWNVLVLDGGFDGPLDSGDGPQLPPLPAADATSGPMRPPTMRAPRCRPISIGNMGWSRNSSAMRPTVSPWS